MNGQRMYVGVYETAARAHDALRRIQSDLARLPQAARVELLSPGRAPQRLEDASDHREAAASLVRCHLVGGGLGLVAGMLLAALARNNAVLANLPPASLWTASIWFGLALGLMAGGAWFLRPRAGLLWSRMRDESRAGHWQVVATISQPSALLPVQAVLRATARDTFTAPGR